MLGEAPVCEHESAAGAVSFLGETRYVALRDAIGNVNPAYRVLSKLVPKGWKMTPEKWERVRRALLD